MGDFEQTPEGGAPLAGPDPKFFDDPVTDCLTNMILELSAQVWVLKERLAAQEELLVREKVMSAGSVETVEFTPEQRAALKQEREEFVAGLLAEIKRLSNANPNP